MVRIQDFHSWHTSSILVESTNPIISIGIIINNLINFIMAKRNQTANEAQLKARRTSLGKKSKEELITIILRKDKSERTMNSKIQELTTSLKEIENRYQNSIHYQGVAEKLTKANDDLFIKNKMLSEKYNRLKDICSFRRKVILSCFGIITILIILLFL